VIKGSEQSLSHDTRYLDLFAYTNLSHRTQHLFAKQRDRIYLLFEAYMKRKRQRGESDTADRTHRILKKFDASGIPGTKIDYLYVDEAQDNLLIDAMLLRSLCRNPNGLFWAGDTAQTIAIGSSFRFNDLKAFLYRLEQRREQGESGIAQSELRTFQLSVNYRSHGGIVRCATVVIESITHFWPYAIDSLAPEQGIVDGDKPVFFSGWDTNTAKSANSDQPPLPSSDALFQKLVSRDSTLYESKGLEFDDVLLYKFFEDSTVDFKQWCVVLNQVETPAAHSFYVPRFDEERHAGVCSELKFLYVAITRSRKNLWILDCSDKAEPMKILWDSKGYIQNYVPGGDVPQPQLARTSEPEEWAATGRELFANQRYLQAKHAFKRAGRARDEKISYTYHLRETADSIYLVGKETISAKRNAFCSAAKSFLECAEDAKGEEQRALFQNAAECFENAGSCGDNMGDYRRAAEAYEKAKEYTPAVKLYRKTDMFDEAVRVLQKHRHEVDEELANSVQEVARLHYFKNKEFRKAETLFKSVEEQLEYLEDNILLDDCHAAVLAELGRHQEAAEVHMAEGRTMEAIDALLDDEENEESKRLANDCILQGLWENTSFTRKIEDTDAAALEFLRLASKVDKDAKLLSPTRKDELEMFQTLRKSDDAPTFRQLARRFLSRKENHQTVLCFDHYFTRFPSTLEITNVDMVTILEDFGQYCRSFRDLILGLDVTNEDTQKLFGFRPASIVNAYRIRTETWLYQRVMDTLARRQALERNDELITDASTKLRGLERDNEPIVDGSAKLQVPERDGEPVTGGSAKLPIPERDGEPVMDASAKLPVPERDNEPVTDASAKLQALERDVEPVTDASAKLQVLDCDDEFIVVSSDELQRFLQAVLWQRLERRILDETNHCHGFRIFTPCLPFVMNSECRRVNCPRHHVDYQDLTQDWFNCQVRIHLLQILIYHVYLGSQLQKIVTEPLKKGGTC
ncbi:hypothetical protein EST38_g14419, partial [Candolleomyces aberdarensis]